MAEQCKEDESDGTKLEMGETLACLLANPQFTPECLGDDFSVSMIGDQSVVGPSSGILDASIAPSLV